MKKHWHILLLQVVLLLAVLGSFFYLKGLGDKQVYGSGRNRYFIEVHNDLQQEVISYTIESYETQLDKVLEELQETKAFSYQLTNGELSIVNDMEAKKELTAYWLIKVNWDKEYRKVQEVTLQDMDTIWIMYAQEKW